MERGAIPCPYSFFSSFQRARSTFQVPSPEDLVSTWSARQSKRERKQIVENLNEERMGFHCTIFCRLRHFQNKMLVREQIKINSGPPVKHLGEGRDKAGFFPPAAQGPVRKLGV